MKNTDKTLDEMPPWSSFLHEQVVTVAFLENSKIAGVVSGMKSITT